MRRRGSNAIGTANGKGSARGREKGIVRVIVLRLHVTVTVTVTVIEAAAVVEVVAAAVAPALAVALGATVLRRRPAMWAVTRRGVIGTGTGTAIATHAIVTVTVTAIVTVTVTALEGNLCYLVEARVTAKACSVASTARWVQGATLICQPHRTPPSPSPHLYLLEPNVPLALKF